VEFGEKASKYERLSARDLAYEFHGINLKIEKQAFRIFQN